MDINLTVEETFAIIGRLYVQNQKLSEQVNVQAALLGSVMEEGSAPDSPA